MAGRVFFCTWDNGYFGSADQAWTSLDVTFIGRVLEEKTSRKVVFCKISEAITFDFREGDVLIYCSSENQEYRSYIRDVVYLVNKKIKVIPSFDHLMAHENKGFQQIYRAAHGFGELNGKYFCTRQKYDELSVPFVLKKVSGAGSSGVFLVRSHFEKLKHRLFFLPSVKRIAINLLRLFKLSKSQYLLYSFYKQRFARLVSQDYIDGLDFDYKLIVMGNRYYGLKRYVRNGDFRASGSGKLEFSDIPEAVLNYADRVFSVLDAPYVSLDIAQKDDACYLIEYQVLNFGPIAIKDSIGFYEKNGERWEFQECNPDLNFDFANALAIYIARFDGA